MLSALFSVIKSNKVTDSTRTIEEIIESRGFKCEVHKVTTNDGYILTVHRIVNPLNENRIKRPILCWHAFAANSSHFVINSEENSRAKAPPANAEDAIDPYLVDDALGFALANGGHDVWLGNSRGSKYSLEHEVLDYETDPEFWDFGIDEQVDKDLPATIAHIIRTTRHKSIGYVGLSQGTTLMFALLASQRHYNHIIRPFVALGPVVSSHYVAHFFPRIIKQAVLGPLISGLNSVPPGPMLPVDLDEYTKIPFVGHRFENVMNYISKLNNNISYTNDLKRHKLSVIAGHQGCHLSRKNMAHSLQIHLSNRLEKFDYGQGINLGKYGSLEPPLYKLQNIKNQFIAIIYAPNDAMVKDKDLARLRRKLQVPLFDDYEIPNRKYNHLDFILGNKLGYYVNARVLKIIQQVQHIENKMADQGVSPSSPEIKDMDDSWVITEEQNGSRGSSARSSKKKIIRAPTDLKIMIKE
ncbi:Gastric triacylglycerol lipase [Halotydeus destructor]|nr:Gastric triacylglycerol lipase [Halotydeus destructor]